MFSGKSLGDIPTFNGAALDLYKFYKLVDERGGFHEVSSSLFSMILGEKTEVTGNSNQVKPALLRGSQKKFGHIRL